MNIKVITFQGKPRTVEEKFNTFCTNIEVIQVQASDIRGFDGVMSITVFYKELTEGTK